MFYKIFTSFNKGSFIHKTSNSFSSDIPEKYAPHASNLLAFFTSLNLSFGSSRKCIVIQSVIGLSIPFIVKFAALCQSGFSTVLLSSTYTVFHEIICLFYAVSPKTGIILRYFSKIYYHKSISFSFNHFLNTS